MKKIKKILVLICLLPLFSYAQKIPDFGFNKVRIAEGDGMIQAEILPVSSVPVVHANRFYYWYSANEIHRTQGGFSGRLLNGSYHEYYPNKNLKEQGLFYNGLKDGVWKSWAEDGLLTQTYTWDKGVRSGKFALYNSEGKVTRSGKYRKDVMVNDSISFWKKINVFKKKKP